jgi:hypothetical protein
VVLIVLAIVLVVVTRSGSGSTKAGPGGPTTTASGASTSPASAATPSGSATDPLKADAAAWADFPVNATPRPVVLLGQAIDDPQTGFRDSDSKIAYMDGRLKLAAALPATPVAVDGYEISSAADAVKLMQKPEGKGPSTSMTLQITEVTFVQHVFATDRGNQALPAWQLRIAGVADPAYVLAVAASEQFNPMADRSYGGPSVTVSADGRDLTVPFIAHHTSTGPCDDSFSQTLGVTETPNVVVLDIETVTEQPSAPPSAIACAAVGSAEQPDPGEATTRTVALDNPLGARVVVDGHGMPFAATS